MAVLGAISAGLVLTVAAGARRADSAYDRFTVATDAHDVMVLGQPFDVDLAVVAALPEVSEAVPVAYVLPYEPERDEAFGVTPLVSVDGGFFTRMDRPRSWRVAARTPTVPTRSPSPRPWLATASSE